jgi:hypothetical protein
MDSFGQRSTQQDIVFFERDFCPVYSINDTPEATYFPVEGVIAVGEVKNVVDKATLFDALHKIRSAKVLRRFSERTKEGVTPAAASFRPYGASTRFAAVPADEYDQERKFLDQVFGFVICKSFRNSGDAILDNLVEFSAKHGVVHMPNIIVSLDDGFVQHASLPSMSLQHSPMSANAFAFVPDQAKAFAVLVDALRQYAREGRTVPLYGLDRYMTSITGPFPASRFRQFPVVT